MFVGVSTVDLFLPGMNSLKSKRRIINSIKSAIRVQFNVGISEVGYMDKWQRALIGIVAVSNDSKFIQSLLQKVVNRIRDNRNVNIINWRIKVNNGFETETDEFTYNGDGV
ncbi:MAG: DUF503 domain-containing protein [candidate division WOR-3 bacterium]|nr:DUF503 domain-containing protein [candidate division WOR-3 bacterium]